MSFPPAFLDELRARIPLGDLIGRRVRLIKKGREYSGLCPFHNEKSPSFTVNDDKGFFHCFGCGAHGDAIGFTMRAGNMGFLDAVETLAREAGLEVPAASPQEREQATRQKTLHAVLDAACAFFEAQLRSQGGRAALEYLRGRGLDDKTIARFRLGYAPAVERSGQGLLKQALLREFPEPLLFEAGLVRRPEDGRDSYDYFRGRVMFPITDRTGRVIAFGGRVIGDGQPKYLNSPDTPLFQKGRVLYGLALARVGAARGGDVIVTEGYMDVIALHRAGMEGAVAPLGTALTETQIEELWRLTPWPILCFDGDAAGQRAAARAVDRTLPILKPGHSLRFATLTGGDDPDTMIAKHGAKAMQDVLAAARPLAEVAWQTELAAKPLDTPEAKADLEARLKARVATIKDAGVARQYDIFFRQCVFDHRRPQRAVRSGEASGRPQGPGKAPGRLRWGDKGPAWGANAPVLDDELLRARRRDPATGRLSQELLVLGLLNHPALLDELIEDFAGVELPAADLDRLRREIINLHVRYPGLDVAGFKHHLSNNGFTKELESLLRNRSSSQAAFARAETDDETARRGWTDVHALWQERRGASGPKAAQVDEAVRDFEDDPEAAWARVMALHAQAETERLSRADFEDEPDKTL